MDIKIEGINKEIMQIALIKQKLHVYILSVMDQAIDGQVKSYQNSRRVSI